jgi:hypothetical protein
VVAVLVDREGLVRVAAERLERDRVGGLAVAPDLEDVAVVLQAGGAVRLGLGLLTGQPGAPRRVAAGAVGEGAGDADPLAEVLAVPVDRDHGAATGRADAGVVHGAFDRRYAERAGAADLVVLDQQVLAPAGVEDRRTVVQGRGRLPGPELGLAGPGDDPVPEARRQGEDAGGVVQQRRERPVRGVRRVPRTGRGLGERRDGADGGEADSRGAGGGTPEDGTAGNRHDGAPWYVGGRAAPDAILPPAGCHRGNGT